MSAAIAGSDVAMTVESMFSMNRATATMSGTRRSLFMERRAFVSPASVRRLRNAGACLHSRPWTVQAGGLADDLHPRCPAAAARAAAQRSAVLGTAQPGADRAVPDLRARVPRAAAGAFDPRHHCRAHEAREPQASRDDRGDRAPRRAARMEAVSRRTTISRPPLRRRA